MKTSQDTTIQDKAWQDKTRHDNTQQDTIRQDKTRQDKTGQDTTRQDKSRQDKTRQDKTNLRLDSSVTSAVLACSVLYETKYDTTRQIQIQRTRQRTGDRDKGEV